MYSINMLQGFYGKEVGKVGKYKSYKMKLATLLRELEASNLILEPNHVFRQFVKWKFSIVLEWTMQLCGRVTRG